MKTKLSKFSGFKKLLILWGLTFLVILILNNLFAIKFRLLFQVSVLIYILYDFLLHFTDLANIDYDRKWKGVFYLVQRDEDEDFEVYDKRLDWFWTPYWGMVFFVLVSIFFL
jgi:hypothetical protein